MRTVLDARVRLSTSATTSSHHRLTSALGARKDRIFDEGTASKPDRKAEIVYKRDGAYYIQVTIENNLTPATRDDASQNGVVLGVDLNVAGYSVVTSTGTFLGTADYLIHSSSA